MLKIGVDLDGVVVDFIGGAAAHYERWFGVALDPKKVNGSYAGIYDVSHFPSRAEFWAWADRVPNFWVDLPAIPGALGALYELEREYGHQFTIITARPESARAGTAEWVRSNWPSAQMLPTIHHVPAGSKGTIGEVQVYIDDSPEELESLRDKPCVLCFDQPWNKDFKGGDRVHRVADWSAVRKFLHLLEHPEAAEVEQ